VRPEAGGSVAGLMREGAWEAEHVRLERGDLFVAFTDGIREAMNNADDEWGGERLSEAARAMGHPGEGDSRSHRAIG
jgi:sigma-B regulation protein RsbU (phosphoserine phosphatase)